MSENIEVPNIIINNSSEGSQSILDRIFDIGFKILIPLLLVGALILIYVVVKIVIPFVSGAVDIFSDNDLGVFLPFLFGPLGGLASLFFGR